MDYEADEDYINLPVIPGIECVGEVVDPSDDPFEKGDKVVALMGGMGRTFDGSYCEYALLPKKNVFKIKENVFDSLSLEEIIAIPETYFTAYGSIEGLQLKKDDSILIRGATSATGITAMQLAKAIGATVIATSRDESRFEMLKDNGADEVLVDDGKLEEKIPDGVDKVLELIGSKTLEDSMKCLREFGICCNTGILGGMEYVPEFDPIKTIPNNRYLTSFFSNYPTQEIMDRLFQFVIDNDISPKIGKIFTDLDEISQAHKLMESNEAQGKIIFRLI
jgi:NADPH:quinone reductase-like Zn-dependent oxidoreductase